MHLADSPARGGRFGIRAYLAGVLMISLAIIGFATSLAARDLSNRGALDDGAAQPSDVLLLRVDGSVLWEFDSVRSFETVNGVPGSGGAIDGAGPTIANGFLYLNSGYPNGGGMPGNVLIALSIDGQ